MVLQKLNEHYNTNHETVEDLVDMLNKEGSLTGKSLLEFIDIFLQVLNDSIQVLNFEASKTASSVSDLADRVGKLENKPKT